MSLLNRFVAVLVMCLPVQLLAEGLPQPTGPVLLTISGDITHTNVGQEAHFDRAMLETIGWTELTTLTGFTDGPQDFAGPSAAALFEAVGAGGTEVMARALNDYSTVIEISQMVENNAIFAMDNNGTPMRVRDKGPLWVIFPLTAEEVQEKKFFAQTIWQLSHMTVQ